MLCYVILIMGALVIDGGFAIMKHCGATEMHTRHLVIISRQCLGEIFTKLCLITTSAQNDFCKPFSAVAAFFFFYNPYWLKACLSHASGARCIPIIKLVMFRNYRDVASTLQHEKYYLPQSRHSHCSLQHPLEVADLRGGEHTHKFYFNVHNQVVFMWGCRTVQLL